MPTPEGAPRKLQTAPFDLQRVVTPESPEAHKPGGFSLKDHQPGKSTTFAPTGVIFNPADIEKRRQTPDIFSNEWVAKEVKKERQKPRQFGVTPWYHLAGTGFWVEAQVSQLMRNVANAGRDNFSTVVDEQLSNVGVDTRAFVDEYLEQMVNLRWNLAIGEVDGKQRIICTDYSNRTLESVTSTDEREGVVHKTLFGNKEEGIEGLEERIINAEEDSTVIATSFDGWSGLKDAAGNNIIYPESQIYVIKKLKHGKLQAYTLRYKANASQNEVFQRSLGLTIPEAATEKERIKNGFRNFALITPDDADQAEREGRKSVRGFEDVVDLMQQAVGGREEAYEGKTFDDMRVFIRHPERFSRRHPLTEKLIRRFEDYARWRFAQGGTYEDIATDLQIAMAFNPTQLGKLYREEGNVKLVTDDTGIAESIAAQRLRNFIQVPGGINYQQEHAHLKELPGCAGGGSSQIRINSMGSSRKGEIEPFTCPRCNTTASGAVGNQCPACGLTKEEYAEAGGLVC